MNDGVDNGHAARAISGSFVASLGEVVRTERTKMSSQSQRPATLCSAFGRFRFRFAAAPASPGSRTRSDSEKRDARQASSTVLVPLDVRYFVTRTDFRQFGFPDLRRINWKCLKPDVSTIYTYTRIFCNKKKNVVIIFDNRECVAIWKTEPTEEPVSIFKHIKITIQAREYIFKIVTSNSISNPR